MEIKRDEYVNQLINHRDNNMIKIITGIRRCGKSYLLNKLFYKYLIDSNIKSNNIIRFAFDFDEDVEKLDRFYPELPTKIEIGKNKYVINSKKFRAYIKELMQDNSQFYYLLLDEVQLLENFVGTLNGYLNYDNVEVYVTGSNSRFLSSDIVTEFRGRGDVIYVQPLSFNEYYNTIGGDKRNALQSYMNYGGLPQCALLKDDTQKQNYLTNIYKTIYLADLKQRNNIYKIDEFDTIVSIISSSIGSPINSNKIANTFKSVNHSKISSLTIRKYISYLEDAFLINEAKRYNVKGRKYIGSNEKYYFTDLGIRNSIIGYSQFEPPHIMENLIYNELINRGFAVDVGIVEKNVHYKNGNGGKEYYEVDFVAQKGFKKYYIQSAYSIPDKDKEKQEEKSLDNINDNFQKIIITFDDFVSYHINQKGYILMNIFEFLEIKEYLN